MTAGALAGRRIAITRARAQGDALRRPLEALGADVVEIPTIAIRNPESWEPLDGAIQRLEQFDFLILTSVNGVEKLLERLKACGKPLSALGRLEVGAIGPATAEALAREGVRVDFIPQSYQAEGLVEALQHRSLAGKVILIPRAAVARDLVQRALRARGAQVEVVAAYRTVLPAFTEGTLTRLLAPPPDLVTFTSSSTATNFARLIEEHGLTPCKVKAASIGPITSGTARQLGFEVVLEAAEFTIPGLVSAIRAYFSSSPAS